MKFGNLLLVVGLALTIAACSGASQGPSSPASPSASVISSGVAGAQTEAKATGGVIVSDQNDCAIGPTNVNSLAPNQTAYIWLVTSSSVLGDTYQITGTSSSFDTGILKVKFSQCTKPKTKDFWAKFTTPTVSGGFTLTVFDAAGKKISSDNFSVN